MALIQLLLTLLFGAIPATYLCILPIFLIFVGAAAPESGSSSDSIFVFAYAGAAIYGTISLWVVAFKGPSIFTMTGLVLGLAAISPFTLAVLTGPRPFQGRGWDFDFLVTFPAIVALVWIIGVCVSTLAAFGNKSENGGTAT